jgi:hypothetical protein
MTKRLNTLLVLLLLSSTTFSQKDTSKICFPYPTARQIAIDLVRGDSAIAELKVVNKLVWQLNEKSEAQDSLISLHVERETNYVKQINNYENIIVEKDKIITGLEKNVTDLTRKNNNLKSGIKWLGGGFVASVLTIITFIVVK